MAQYGFAFIGNRCTGCKTCQLACKDYHDLSDVNFRRVYEYGGGTCRMNDEGRFEASTFVYYVSSACNHCTDPACVQVCPTGAMHKDEETGLVNVDAGRCLGCGSCALSCPYGNPAVDKEAGRSVKCTGCIDRVKEGKKPICAEACPLRALEFDEIGVLRAKYGDTAAIAPLPDPGLTHPNVVIVKPAGAIAPGAAGGSILNGEEVQ